MVEKMNNKICWLTSEESFLNNYGAALQGYALNTILTRCGYKPVIVKYRGGNLQPFRKLSFKKKVKCVLSFVKGKIVSVTNFKIFCAKKRFKNFFKKRNGKFLDFYNSNFVFEYPNRICWGELESKKIDADIYLCGSDQIWNPYFKNGYNDFGYFLHFAKPNKLKISYAPSFGCSSLPYFAKQNIKFLLESFDYISVRENTGKELIKRETDLDVQVVLDPTLLLTKDDWINIGSFPTNLPEKYILVYRFSNNKDTKRIITEISKITGFPIVVIPLSDVSLIEDKNWHMAFDAGPKEFISLISNASLVCTDSFHATVFSLIFNKPFFVFERENFDDNGNNMNSRIYDLLGIGKLGSRIIKKDFDVKSIFDIDFSIFNANIVAERKKSISWLLGALTDVDCRKN